MYVGHLTESVYKEATLAMKPKNTKKNKEKFSTRICLALSTLAQSLMEAIRKKNLLSDIVSTSFEVVLFSPILDILGLYKSYLTVVQNVPVQKLLHGCPKWSRKGERGGGQNHFFKMSTTTKMLFFPMTSITNLLPNNLPALLLCQAP